MTALAAIPSELRERAQWVCWRRVPEASGKVRKMPVNAATGANASTTDPATWATIEVAMEACQRMRLDGIGVVFSADDPFVGIDLDHCRDPETGIIEPWAREIIDRLSSYAEISPSGTGIHIIVLAALLDGKGVKTGKDSLHAIELYDRGRYFCTTGEHLEGAPMTIEPRQDAVDELVERILTTRRTVAPVVAQTPVARPRNGTNAIARAWAYMNALPVAVAGQRGHDAAYKVVCRLIEGFGLTIDEARPLVYEYSRRCDPQWSPDEIEHKLRDAAKNANPSRIGYLLDAPPPARANGNGRHAATPDLRAQLDALHAQGARVEVGDDGIRGRLWRVFQTAGMLATEKNREIAKVVTAWLHERGRFYFHEERRDFASVMYFDATRKLLLPVQSDAFVGWLSDALAMNRAERSFAFVQSAVETEGLSERATGIIPGAYWASVAGRIYMSNGPGRMARIRAGAVEMVDNGTDGVIFPYGATLAPWSLTDPRDPFETCALFRDLSTTAPHGKMILRLWVYSLASDQRTKPALVASGTIGSGKTKTVVGIFELYGLPPRIGTVLKTGDGDFWTALDGGGIACFDNADTSTDWFPDALAAAATGGTLEKRRLYTDSDRVSLRARAWVALTSASPTFASDAGLADRLLVVRLGRREGETAEAALSDEIVANRDAGLSFIAQMLATALADTAPVPKRLNARHPDFADLAVRIGRALGRGDEAVAALRAAEADKGMFNLENDVVGAALLDLVAAGAFEGTCSELLDRLRAADASIFDKYSSKRLVKRLMKLWPHLEATLRATSTPGHGGVARYSFQPFDGCCGCCKSGFSGKPLTRENNRTFTENPLSQQPQQPAPDLFTPNPDDPDDDGDTADDDPLPF